MEKTTKGVTMKMYKIVVAESIIVLEEDVQIALSNDWEVVGGVTYVKKEGYLQAMRRTDKNVILT